MWHHTVVASSKRASFYNISHNQVEASVSPRQDMNQTPQQIVEWLTPIGTSYTTVWGGRLSKRFCKHISESSPCSAWAAWQLQYWPHSRCNSQKNVYKTFYSTCRPTLYKTFLSKVGEWGQEIQTFCGRHMCIAPNEISRMMKVRSVPSLVAKLVAAVAASVTASVRP